MPVKFPKPGDLIAGRGCLLHKVRIIVLPLALLGVICFVFNANVPLMSLPFAVCHPKINVVFLKTHKCAGSSIQNILMRFGDNRNLTFVLPSTGNYIGHPVPFNRRLLPAPRLPVYNILAHHSRLNYYEIKRLMPYDAVYITIVRDPVQLFESSYTYYALDKFFGADLQTFLRVWPRLSVKFLNRRLLGKFGINQMLFDLGANSNIFRNSTLVERYVNRLESWFHLVLIAEKMDESLVFLKNLLCWNMDDIVAFKVNARDPKFIGNLTEEQRNSIRRLNSADEILYKRFLSKFEKQIDDFGRDRLERETKELRERTREWYEFCVEGVRTLTTPRTKPKYYINPKIMVFESRHENNFTCRSLTMTELPYTDYLRENQKVRFKIKEITTPIPTHKNLSNRINKKRSKT